MDGIKVVIPINGTKDKVQLVYAGRLQQIFNILGYEVSIINIDASDNPWYVQSYIENEKANLLITIDCSGFDLKLLGDDLFYNSLCIPAMHFLTNKPQTLENELSERMNFTMEFYVMSDEDKSYIEEKCWRVPCVHKLPECFDLEEIKRLAKGEDSMNEYIQSELILETTKGLPDVFEKLFTYAVEKRKTCKHMDEMSVLEMYLGELNFNATLEEKEELLQFVNLGFLYEKMKEFEQCAEYIKNEIERLLEI